MVYAKVNQTARKALNQAIKTVKKRQKVPAVEGDRFVRKKGKK